MVASDVIEELGACLGSLQLDAGRNPVPRYRFVSLDLETTSLIPSKGRVIEIAAVDIESGVFYETLINPAPVLLSKKTCGITGIRASEVTAPGVPSFTNAFKGFLAFVQRCLKDGELTVLVAHNGARFDFLYLRNECARNGLEMPDDWLFVDTLLLAQHFGLKEEVKSGSLSQDSLRAWLKVPEPLVKHRALPDAQVLAAMFPRLLDIVGNPSMAELLATKKRLAGTILSVAVNIQMEPEDTSPLRKMLDSLLPSTRTFTAREFVRCQLERLIHCTPSPNNTNLFKLYNISHTTTNAPTLPPSHTTGLPTPPSSSPLSSSPGPSPTQPMYVLLQGAKVEYTIHKQYAYKDDGMTPHWNLLVSGASADFNDTLVAFGLACDALTRECAEAAGKVHSVVKALNGSTALKVCLRTKLQDGQVSLHTSIHDTETNTPIPLHFTKYERAQGPEHIATVRNSNVDTVNGTLKRHTHCDLLVCPEFVWSSSIGCGVKLTVAHVFINGNKGEAPADPKVPKGRSAPA